MYSLAPAWIAATAARALFSMPQATIGTWMCSSSSFATRSRDVDRDLDHQQVGAAAGAQHRQRLVDGFGVGDGGAAVHRDLGRGGELALERADDEKSHGLDPWLVLRGEWRIVDRNRHTVIRHAFANHHSLFASALFADQFFSALMTSVMVTPSLSSTSTTSPRATSRLLT